MILIKTSYISDIIAAEIQLLMEESDNILITAPIDIYSDFMLVNITFPNGRFKYKITGNDINGVPFTISPSQNPTFEPGNFTIDTNDNRSVEIDLLNGTTIPIIVCNHNDATFQYSFIYKNSTELLQGFHPSNHLVLPPEACGSVNMTVEVRSAEPRSAEPGSTHNLTFSVIDKYSYKTLSLTASIPLPVSYSLFIYNYILCCKYLYLQIYICEDNTLKLLRMSQSRSSMSLLTQFFHVKICQQNFLICSKYHNVPQKCRFPFFKLDFLIMSQLVTDFLTCIII